MVRRARGREEQPVPSARRQRHLSALAWAVTLHLRPMPATRLRHRKLMEALDVTRPLHHSARRRPRFRQHRRRCGPRIRPAPTTARPRPVTRRRRHQHLPGITRQPRRPSSTLPPPRATPRRVPTTAQRLRTCTELEQPHHLTLLRRLPGLRRLQRATPPRVQASTEARECSSLRLALATRLRRLLSRLGLLVRGLLGTSSKFLRRAQLRSF